MCQAPGLSPDDNKCNCDKDAKEGNPINPLSGNKVQVERDYTGNGAFPLVLYRVYNSFGVAPGKFSLTMNDPGRWTPFSPTAGPDGNIMDYATAVSKGRPSNSRVDRGWRHSYDRALTSFSWDGHYVSLFRASGPNRGFKLKAGVWVTTGTEQANLLSQQVDANLQTVGWTYVNENDELERYDPDGKLLSITNPAGLVQVLQYDAMGRLDSVTDPAGRQLKFSYNFQDRLSTVLDPAGGTLTYAYNGGSLTSLTYPDTHTRGYAYNTGLANFLALTGIIDENGAAFATWTYDSQGNAISSEHAGGVEKVTLAYQTPTSTVATDVGGGIRTYTTQIVNGIAHAGSIDEPCGLNCTRTRSMTYDDHGNVATSTDGNGVLTTYRYDLGRDLQTSRTEASGTQVARTISTGWHATRRLPVKVAEPKRITTYLYDGVGNLLEKTVQDSNDANGAQGLAAAGVGAIRKWTYAYNGSGQILSITGPRTDVLDRTVYTYDPVTGDLGTITNAANHVTTLSNYDAHGHAGRIVAPNGVTSDLSYTPRGWLSSRTDTANGASETTSYDYDYVGQLKKVTLPDSSVINYIYDDAHRLTTISDSIGNSINYTHDKMSNRIQEQVKDPAGTLTRNTSRTFDTLNRVQQQTGGAQ